MSGASEHPLDAELRDYLSHSDLRLMAEGKHAEFLQRAQRLRVRRSHYLTGLSVVPWAVLLVWVLRLYSRVPSAPLAVVVLAVLLATMFAVKLWLCPGAGEPSRRRSLAWNVTSPSGPRTERRAADAGLHNQPSQPTGRGAASSPPRALRAAARR
jgi:hypothetical protein